LKYLILTVLEANLIFSCLRSTPHNITKLSYHEMRSCIERGLGSDFSPCEMPEVTLCDTGLNKSDLAFLVMDTSYTLLTNSYCRSKLSRVSNGNML